MEGFAVLSDALDRHVWGALTSFLGLFGRFTGLVSKESDEEGLNGGFDRASEGLRGAGQVYSRSQSGDVHTYLRAIAIGFVMLVLVLSLGGIR